MDLESSFSLPCVAASDTTGLACALVPGHPCPPLSSLLRISIAVCVTALKKRHLRKKEAVRNIGRSSDESERESDYK
jgi:hypothetical protein